MKIEIDESIKRPSWTQTDLHAYRHKRGLVNGKFKVLKDYYVHSKGQA